MPGEWRAEALRLVQYDTPHGCIGDDPQTNAPMRLDSYADKARTPTPESIPVLLERSRVAA